MGDLAKMFVKKYSPNKKVIIRSIGNRGGEKKHEELVDTSDLDRDIFQNKEMFIIAPPQPVYVNAIEDRVYSGFTKIKNSASLTLSSVKSINVGAIKKLI